MPRAAARAAARAGIFLHFALCHLRIARAAKSEKIDLFRLNFKATAPHLPSGHRRSPVLYTVRFSGLFVAKKGRKPTVPL